MHPQESSQVWTISVQPVSDRFAPADDRWRDQITTFYHELDREVGGVERMVEPVDGTKGGIETVILALGSAGAFSAAIEFFRAWLGRDRTRSLSITWNDGQQENHITLDGEGLDRDVLQRVATAAAARIGGSWPAADPAHPA